MRLVKTDFKDLFEKNLRFLRPTWSVVELLMHTILVSFYSLRFFKLSRVNDKRQILQKVISPLVDGFFFILDDLDKSDPPKWENGRSSDDASGVVGCWEWTRTKRPHASATTSHPSVPINLEISSATNQSIQQCLVKSTGLSSWCRYARGTVRIHWDHS